MCVSVFVFRVDGKIRRALFGEGCFANQNEVIPTFVMAVGDLHDDSDRSSTSESDNEGGSVQQRTPLARKPKREKVSPENIILIRRHWNEGERNRRSWFSCY